MSRKRIPVSFMDREFSSLKDAADAYGIPYSTFRDAYREGSLAFIETKLRRTAAAVQGDLLASAEAPRAEMPETKRIRYKALRATRFDGVAIVPAHVTEEDVAAWFRENNMLTGMQEGTTEWNWGSFVLDTEPLDDFRGAAVALSSDDFPARYDAHSKPPSDILPAGPASVTITVQRALPVPDISIEAQTYAAVDGSRWILFDGAYRFINEQGRVIIPRNSHAAAA